MKIIIVGGGTSGWLTSLYINHILPDSNITLIESKEIGVVGVGEGSTPNFTHLLKRIGISLKDFLKETNSTIKLGISFENWKEDGSKYFHDFGTVNPINSFYNNSFPNSTFLSEELNYPLYSNVINNPEKISQSLINEVAYNNLSPFDPQQDNTLNNLFNYSLHFDSTLLTKYLKSVALERNINVIEGTIKKINQNSQGDITSIEHTNGQIECDFVFDCSGFHRLIIGKLYKSKWKSYQSKLKVNNAITFPLTTPDEIFPYTKAIAMDYGWLFQIPLQHRMGCGYIFDSNYISLNEAKKEVEKYLGHSVNFNKHIEFEAGQYEQVWINNCIAIGLSSGFLEPLEATSIMTQCYQLNELDAFNITSNLPEYREKYNKYVLSVVDDVVDFIHFHYLTNKTNTLFWKDYRSTTDISPYLNNLLKLFDTIPFSYINEYKPKAIFADYSYFLVGMGISNTIFNKEINTLHNNIFKLDTHLKDWWDFNQQVIKHYKDKLIHHNAFLNFIQK
jgi:tryptophan halogenase